MTAKFLSGHGQPWDPVSAMACHGDLQSSRGPWVPAAAPLPNWADYEQNCTGFLSDTYFPSTVTLPAGTKVPFGRVQIFVVLAHIHSATTWMNATFNSPQAQAIANEGKPDFVFGQDSGGRKSKGAIVGGVVGGVAILAIGAAIVFWFIRKSTRHGVGQPQILRRSMSDPSHRSIHTPEDMSFAHRHPGDAYPQSLAGPGFSDDLCRIPRTDRLGHTWHPGDAHPLPHVLKNTSASVASSQHAQLQLAGTSDLAYVNPFEPATSPVVITGSGSEKTLRDAYNTQEVAAALASTPTATVEHSDPARPNLQAYTLDPFRSLSESPEPTEGLYSSPRSHSSDGKPSVHVG
ncbi:hypothetical protein GGX14DRAFT_657987 [Mycena pura]|uniref:Uncharacterized protein n=1 Tax=Mycena pura TaxID=153505 RepID=A0AAD6YM26_9AGAR|nr:hypothetical protein GGX14DRAFT_657987 [Mycena pura]